MYIAGLFNDLIEMAGILNEMGHEEHDLCYADRTGGDHNEECDRIANLLGQVHDLIEEDNFRKGQAYLAAAGYADGEPVDESLSVVIERLSSKLHATIEYSYTLAELSQLPADDEPPRYIICSVCHYERPAGQDCSLPCV